MDRLCGVYKILSVGGISSSRFTISFALTTLSISNIASSVSIRIFSAPGFVALRAQAWDFGFFLVAGAFSLGKGKEIYNCKQTWVEAHKN